MWLIAAGGALFALFPAAYAAAFSGFYLPFMVVLWLLMFRGIAMELRDHLDSDLWHKFWDTAFWLSSALLIVLFGCAGKLVRGVPLDLFGYFQGTFGFLLNPYALLIAVFGLAALAQHGAAFAVMRIDGAPALRAARLMRGLWWVVLALYLGASAATFATRGAPAGVWPYVVPIASLAALIGLRAALARGLGFATFAASAAFLISLLAEAAGTLYPYLLPSFPAGHGGISIQDAAPSPLGLTVALTVTIAGSIAGSSMGRPSGGAWRARFASNRRRVKDYVARALTLVRPVALDAVFDRQPFGAGRRVRRARARPAQPGGHRRRARAYLRRAFHPARGSPVPRGCVDAVLELGEFRRHPARRGSANGWRPRTSCSFPTARLRSTCVSGTRTTRSNAECSSRFSATGICCAPKSATKAGNQYELLERAGIRYPRRFASPGEIDRLVMVKAPHAQSEFRARVLSRVVAAEYAQPRDG